MGYPGETAAPPPLLITPPILQLGKKEIDEGVRHRSIAGNRDEQLGCRTGAELDQRERSDLESRCLMA